MSVAFNADEIFAMAEQIERNGAKFYRKAAEGPAGVTSKELLLSLAEWEDQHERLFASMRAELGATEAASTAFDPNDEAALYLQAVADGHVFDVKTDPSEKLTGKETTAEVLKTAIGLEKDSIVFYLGIRESVGKTMGREKIESIIQEEMRHVTVLSEDLARAEKA